MIINHVMSNDVQSGIFSDIMNYMRNFKPNNTEIVISKKPILEADIYHYHRPHLEDELIGNSVCTVHHDLTETDNWLSYEKFDSIYRKSKKIICLNSNQEAFLNEKGIKNTTIIPHGYNNNVFDSIKEKKEKNKKIKLGLISKRYGRKVKGEEYLYEIAKRLCPETYSFMLVGEGRSLDAEVLRKLGFKVDVFEYLPYMTFKSLYNEIDVLLMTSLHEGGPANIPEAIASGTPVVGNNIGMVTDYIIDGYNGYYLSNNPDEDEKVFHQLEKSIKLIQDNAIRHAHKAITWEENINKHFQVYDNLITKRV